MDLKRIQIHTLRGSPQPLSHQTSQAEMYCLIILAVHLKTHDDASNRDRK